MRIGSTTKLLDVIDACYRLDDDDATWIRGLVDAASPMLTGGLGVAAYTFDARDARDFKMLDGAFPPGVDMSAMRAFLASVPADYVEKTWLGAPSGFASRVEGFDELAKSLAAFGGAKDVLAINGRDPTGYGIWLGTLLPETGTPTTKWSTIYTQIAAHLTTAFRGRRALGGAKMSLDLADAVLSPSGKLEHAQGEATHEDAVTTLRGAAIRFEKAKKKTARAEPEKTLAEWTGLVDARWTLLDCFDRDGKRFVVARRNEATVARIADLTERERQVVAHAALGHSNKEIAYELGIAASTVRVLLHRAAAKVGVTSRAGVVDVFTKAAKTKS